VAVAFYAVPCHLNLGVPSLRGQQAAAVVLPLMTSRCRRSAKLATAVALPPPPLPPRYCRAAAAAAAAIAVLPSQLTLPPFSFKHLPLPNHGFWLTGTLSWSVTGVVFRVRPTTCPLPPSRPEAAEQ
jgi:hypothetical protein